MVNDQGTSTESKPTAVATLFVGKLPKHAKSADLEAFFGEIGPIRKCFVVADNSNGKVPESDPNFKNKGIGYVHFAVREDAQEALEKLKDAKFLGEHKIKMEFALRKAVAKAEKARRSAADNEPRPKKRKTHNTPNVEQHVSKKKKSTKDGGKDSMDIDESNGHNQDGKQEIQQAESDIKRNKKKKKNARSPVDQGTNRDEKEINSMDTDESNEHNQDGNQQTQLNIKRNKNKKKKNAKSPVDQGTNHDEDETNSMDIDKNNQDGDQQIQQGESGNKRNRNKKKNAKSEVDRQIELSRTLFVRNLSYEASEEELKNLFEQFGPVKFAVITKTSQGISRGSGFVCMESDVVDDILKQAETLKRLQARDDDDSDAAEDTANSLLTSKRNKKKRGLEYESILTPDAASGLAAKFTLHGRVLEVLRAVDKNEAQKIKENKKKMENVKKDKRNVYLLYEGLVLPKSEQAKEFTQAELQAREMSFNNRKRLLKQDPTLYVSKVRLSIRNLPLNVDNARLKQVAMEAVKKFKEGAQAGEWSDLTEEEKSEGYSRRIVVKQAKISRDSTRIDSSTGKPRSKGYGFIEYANHAHALAALRFLNNNAEIFKGKRLICEFALENKNVVERRKKKIEAAKAEAKARKAAK